MIPAKTSHGLRASSFPGNTLFRNFFNTDWPGPDWWETNDSPEWIPAVNVKESDNEFTVDLSVPGYTKKDIQVEVNDNILYIKGERKEETDEKKENYTRKEFSYGTFSRSFNLPETVDAEKVSAKCREGVLSVHLPKKESGVLKDRKKEIAID